MTEKIDSKKILVLLGSPRKKGNSTLLAQKIMVYGSADKPGEIKSNQTLMEEAEALGAKLVQG